ncbi:ATP-grasp domain-containing protein [Candidatus Parabeggiatoa sp. HSG14]|uniref:ATP-grasp domain-containing protein n=1 Tax=Candidatus Parabeggiatoa sp. HSG14 TaxID=3055593 RepID=UPI0025A811A1|nr:ATP-grasp domain-containing protein [Thiotrichales bacterium HSG14]
MKIHLIQKVIDSDYVQEAKLASACSLPYSLINYEALVDDNNVNIALKRIQKTKEFRAALYRGWMMKPEKYAILYHALKNYGVKLINSPAQYQHCHYLPESYPIIQEMTPKTLWIKNGDDFSQEAIMKMLKPFANHSVILKDYVKSQKHYWHEACFIPSTTDSVVVSKIVQRFLELQGGQPEGGLVFRQYVAFESIGSHSKSKMPLSLEYRIFFFNKKTVTVYPYWNEGEYPKEALPLKQFEKIAQRVDSHFFTMDVAKSSDKGWLIIELGDAQVAGLPDNANIEAFYRRLASLENEA